MKIHFSSDDLAVLKICNQSTLVLYFQISYNTMSNTIIDEITQTEGKIILKLSHKCPCLRKNMYPLVHEAFFNKICSTLDVLKSLRTVQTSY